MQQIISVNFVMGESLEKGCMGTTATSSLSKGRGSRCPFALYPEMLRVWKGAVAGEEGEGGDTGEWMQQLWIFGTLAGNSATQHL